MTPSRRDFLSALGTGGLGLPVVVGARAAVRQGLGDLDVTQFGAVGDGDTPCWEAFQTAIDAAEAQGGGVVTIPAGVFLLERTPLIATRVHVQGAGAATVLRGYRPDGKRGAALVSNKGQQEEGYRGAHDWSVSHLAIDSPHTNGIVVTHARNVYIGFIYGTDVYDHFIDTAGENIVCENLFLTGRSGASAFQIDSLSGSQAIWDGEVAVPPLYDGTDTTNLILRSSIITAPAGYTGTEDHHESSVHFHGDATRSFLFSDLVLGGARFGFYQDAESRYEDIRISNVISRNPGCAGWFGPGAEGQQGLNITGLTHEPVDDAAVADESQRSLYFHGRRDVVLTGLRLIYAGERATDSAIQAEASEGLMVAQSVFEGRGGTAIMSSETLDSGPRVTGCIFRNFDTGIVTDSGAAESLAMRTFNSFVNTPVDIRVNPVPDG